MTNNNSYCSYISLIHPGFSLSKKV
ncbi:hypothetical protein [Bacillus manliponensis]